MPKRSQSPITRFSPAWQAATIANRSARFISGRRTLLRIRRRTSSCTSPRSTIFSGGMMIPSSKTVVAPVGSEPGSRPPASIWWPNWLDQPTSSSSKKIGTSTSQSLVCEIDAEHLYGSLVRITSPG